MALWGDKDNISVGVGATAYISSYTKNETYGGYPVIGAGSAWGSSGYAQVGDVIRFGKGVAGAGGTYYGEGIINAITGVGACFIASTEGIISAFSASSAISTTFTVSQSPTFAVQDSRWSARNTDANSYTAGVSSGGATSALGTQYEVGVGWVGVQTYVDSGSNLRVKKEILVSMSGIATGNAPIWDSNPMA